MKTTIWMPDKLFRRADDLAQRRGLSRGQLYREAVSEYVERRRREDITARLNEVLAREPNELDPVFARLQAASLPPGNPDW